MVVLAACSAKPAVKGSDGLIAPARSSTTMITTKEPGSNVCLPLAPYCCKLAELEGW